MICADVTFRDADVHDVPAIHAVIQSAYRGDDQERGWAAEGDLPEGERVTLGELADIMRSKRDALLLALAGARLLGCVRITEAHHACCAVGLLAVEPEMQAVGLGKRLLAEAELLAQSKFGAREMSLSVLDQRKRLIAFYQRRGYQLTGVSHAYPFPIATPSRLLTMSRAL